MRKENILIYSTPDELANEFAAQLMGWIGKNSGNTFHLAISGGKTPDILFSVLAKKYARSVLWQKVHFWWVDERMVPPTDAESNFGVVQQLLFRKISIPEANIHRIEGENVPEAEALSYSAQIRQSLPQFKSWPVFDLVLLGMGDDGHTASIFPNQMELLHSEEICNVATHPTSGQKRVTLTGKAINQAGKICFLVTGQGKAMRLSEIVNNQEKATQLPASHIHPTNGILEWYIDKAAAVLIKTDRD